MIWIFFICLAALVLLLQRKLAGFTLERLQYRTECDRLLAEPDEPVTLRTQIDNHGLLPVLYFRLLTTLPAGAVLHGDPQWVQDHVRARPLETCVEEIGSLLPRRRRVSTLRVSLPKRGWYPMGSAAVCVGDFLGLREVVRREEARSEVVVIPRLTETPALLRTLGGFLGDVSVRRFILEDPILTAGFREYTGREPMKNISWPQSARSGRLLVKQFDYTTDWNVTVLLNTFGGTAADLEQCYCLTRTVCQVLERKGIPYAFATNGDLSGPMGFLSHLAEGLGPQHLNTILYGLGRAKGRCRFSFGELAAQVLRDRRTGKSFILITPSLTASGQRTAEQLRSASGSLCLLVGQEVSE